MAFKKGISGNPGGRSREKIFTDALRLELNRIDPNDKEKRKKINKLAEKLVECAIEDKQSWAFQQIVDRLEGRPCRWSTDGRRSPHPDQFSDAEQRRCSQASWRGAVGWMGSGLRVRRSTGRLDVARH